MKSDRFNQESVTKNGSNVWEEDTWVVGEQVVPVS